MRRGKGVGWEGSTRHPAGMRGGKAAAAMARDVGGRAQPHHLTDSAALGGSDGSSNGTDDDDRTRSGKQSRRPLDSQREDALPSARILLIGFGGVVLALFAAVQACVVAKLDAVGTRACARVLRLDVWSQTLHDAACIRVAVPQWASATDTARASPHHLAPAESSPLSTLTCSETP